MRILHIALGAILLFSCGNAAAVETSKTYTNQRFGFSIDYPSKWRLTESAQNGAGAAIESPDGLVSVLVQGHFLAGQTLSQFEDVYRAQFADHAVKVREIGDGFLLEAKGDKTETIVQFRISGGNWASLEATFPLGSEPPEVNDIYKSWQPFLPGDHDRAP